MNISKEDLQCIATAIRTLSMDAVQKANSGHPGMPMGCADLAAVLWTKHLNYHPGDPNWKNRDRFVLSPGHGSLLLYSLLHFAGFGLTLDDIMAFRQMGSRTPGHPEFGHTAGVETTTGPLGQGFANGVGMALARDLLAAEFNRDGETLIDHYIYAIVSDGDLMEGISYEAAALAGHLGLGRLIYIYDSNRITIEGATDLAWSEDVTGRFTAAGWHVQSVDGHDGDAIDAAIATAKAVAGKPCLIIANTTIARGSATMEGSEESHGAPLGEKEVAASKAKIGCGPDEFFCVPPRVYELFAERAAELKTAYDEWQSRAARRLTGETKDRWERHFAAPDTTALRRTLPRFETGKSIATRAAGGSVLEVLFRELPGIAGGSADLGPSNKTFVKGFTETGRGRVGRNIHFGIREHAMAALQNGMAYYGGFIPYSSTFLSFMDYMRPPIRLAALAKLQTVYVFTHDSLFVGEDGPTHQPVEHIAAARCIPNLAVIRPADAEETREAWLAALARTTGPTMLCLTRQNVPVLAREGAAAAVENLARGAYVVRDCAGAPAVIILASGSEVHVAVAAAEELAAGGIAARVVSFASWELFDEQPAAYRSQILSHGTPKVVVEAGARQGWERYAGNHACYITMDGFGESAPAGELAKKYGFTKENVTAKVKAFLASKTN